MADDNSGDLDLFGEPVVYRETKQGRPEHVRSPENANKVMLLLACRKSVKDVALALGVTQPTLRKHYFHELSQRLAAGLKMRAHQLARLNKLAEEGNVSAEKELLRLIDQEQLKCLSDSVTQRGSGGKKEKTKPLGKKEEQALAAKGVGGRFAPRPSPPRLIN